MTAFPRSKGYLQQEKLLGDFLAAVERSRRDLVDLEESEIRALCLEALSRAAGDAPSILMLESGETGGLCLELSSRPFRGEIDKLRLKLSYDQSRELASQPARLGELESFRKMTRSVLGRENVFARTLVQDEKLYGALLVIPQENQSFTSEDMDMLLPLASQIDFLLKLSATFSSLIQKSLVDERTGLFNHRYFEKRMPAEIARAARHGHQLSLLFSEIDEFGNYRKINGSLAAGRLVNEVAAFFRSHHPGSSTGFCFRASDISIRFGEDQFLVILPETPKEGAAVKARRLVKAVAATPFLGREAQPQGKVTLSVGVATFPEDASDTVFILEAADRALDRAREEGMNRVAEA